MNKNASLFSNSLYFAYKKKIHEISTSKWSGFLIMLDKLLGLVIIGLLWHLSIALVFEKEILSAFYSQKPDITTLSGKIENITDSSILILCLVKCMINRCSCKGILFQMNQLKNQRCKHILYGRNTIDLNAFPGFVFYSYDERGNKQCNDLKMAVTLEDWDIPCPRLYFSLDDAQTGSAMAGNGEGASAANVQFVSDAKFGKAMYYPTINDQLKSYYHLGMYKRSNLCFPFPDTCPKGMSISFWLKMKGNTGAVQGLITTMSSNGPGFVVYFYHNNGLYFR